VDSQMRSADYITLRNEQLADPSLSKYWDMARDNQKNGFYIQTGYYTVMVKLTEKK